MFRALTDEDSQQITRILNELLEQVEAEAVFFCDRGGNIIAREFNTEVRNEQNIAALAAGSFFATLEMARMLGESKFRRLIHQGEEMSIYMEGMAGDMLLIVVFSKDSNPGLVKLYAQNACQQLSQFDALINAQGGAQKNVPALNLELNEDAQPFTIRSDR